METKKKIGILVFLFGLSLAILGLGIYGIAYYFSQPESKDLDKCDESNCNVSGNTGPKEYCIDDYYTKFIKSIDCDNDDNCKGLTGGNFSCEGFEITEGWNSSISTASKTVTATRRTAGTSKKCTKKNYVWT